ncbi:MAG: FecCD family ABC transporter permease [Gammaproteobacteria bacterium]
MLRRWGTLLAVSVVLLLCFGFSLSSGSVELSPAELIDALVNPESSGVAQLIWAVRLPRILNAFVTGGLLAFAGVLMQVLLRNPLADPYVLGTSGGAAVAALAVISLGLSSAFIPPAAFVGALLSMLLVFSLSRGVCGEATDRLLLTGIVMAAAWGALINLLLALSEQHNVHAMLFWLMGDLSQSEMPTTASLVLITMLLIGFAMARDMNILTRGELAARALGVNVRAMHWLIYLLASLATATAVTLAGSIGFIGLVVPHMVRRLQGADHRLLLPLSVMLGGALLMLADTLARTVIAPRQLPVGVLTALIGVPVFLYLLRYGAGGRR